MKCKCGSTDVAAFVIAQVTGDVRPDGEPGLGSIATESSEIFDQVRTAQPFAYACRKCDYEWPADQPHIYEANAVALVGLSFAPGSCVSSLSSLNGSAEAIAAWVRTNLDRWIADYPSGAIEINVVGERKVNVAGERAETLVPTEEAKP